MEEDIEVNQDYRYDALDMGQLALLSQSQENNVNNTWCQPIAFNGVDQPLAGGDDIKQLCENLKPNQKLLIPLNLKEAHHWVGTIIERAKDGFKITTMDSLNGNNKNKGFIKDAISKISDILGPKHKVTVTQSLDKKTLKQKDKVSCGPFVIQNLANHANPKEFVELDSLNLRAVHNELLGEDFANKQNLDLEDKSRNAEQNSLWQDILDKQAVETFELKSHADKRSAFLEKQNDVFEKSLDHLLESSKDKHKDLEEMYKNFPEQKELLDDISHNMNPSSLSKPQLDSGQFEKSLDKILNLENDLTKRIALEKMAKKFPEQKEFLGDVKQSLSSGAYKPLETPLPNNRRSSSQRRAR